MMSFNDIQIEYEKWSNYEIINLMRFEASEEVG